MRAWTFDVAGDEDLRIDRAKRAAAQSGLSLEGDAITGTIKGSGLEGRYVLSGAKMTVEVEKKPFFASWDEVERQTKGLFAPQG